MVLIIIHMTVRTRFAPSPTGALHIGGVRTALYAYLVAKKNNGQFNLRIEDTDRARFAELSVQDIIETLNWLGLKFDGAVIYQSKRKDIYAEYAKKLVASKFAYEKDGAIYFKVKTIGKSSIIDLVGNRKIEFDNSTQKDFVILKSDGFPTYHLAHVVDDHLMETNPVIRGAEWISSLPKHLMLFDSLNWEVPRYAHLPIILGADRSKLSKRHGAKAASQFRLDGFLPEAILNFMALLGWTPPSGKEILPMEEMISEFDLKDVHIANPVFDIKKLEWMNGEYVRKYQISDIKHQILEYLKYIGGGLMPDHPTEGEVEQITPLVKDRIKTLADFIPLTDFLFEPVEYDKEIFKGLKIPNLRLATERVLEKMEEMNKPWQAANFEDTFRKLAQKLELPDVRMFQLIRVCVSGKLVTPPLFESIKILGEAETIKRVEQVVKNEVF